jgi:predicted regulator of Ras-like GTPase activity (Roadblock/LC7/MglB family)
MPKDLNEELKAVAERVPGCSYVSIVGYDGISVAQHIVDANIDVGLHDAEISSIVLASREVAQNLSLGQEREIIWLTDNAFYILYPLDENFFIYACLRPTGSSPGVARIELNKARESLRKIINFEK